MRRYYQILGVSQNATSAEIKEAWLFSIKAFHPDKFAGSSQKQQSVARERTKAINEAYGVLSDPIKRAAYDYKQFGAAQAESRRPPPERQELSPGSTSPGTSGSNPVGAQPIVTHKSKVWTVVAVACCISVICGIIAFQTRPSQRYQPAPRMAVAGPNSASPAPSAESSSAFESSADFAKYAMKLRAQALLEAAPRDSPPTKVSVFSTSGIDAEAQYNLGLKYFKGEGVSQSYEEAVKWFRKAAEQNYAAAQSNLGVCYDTGEGVAKDRKEAVKWYRKAAEQNLAEAQTFLGNCYFTGEGVAKDYSEAVKWWRKAAEQNRVTAQYNLGNCYFKGEGVAKDQKKAVKWYRKAAEQNLAAAQYNLGNCYAQGEGVAKDYSEAVKWYRKAAEQNDVMAQFNLAVCYFNGDGVAKDVVEAYKWSLLTAAQGKERAKRNVTIMEHKMTREQIAEGQTLARNFRPREVPVEGSDSSSASIEQSRPEASGSGFFITEDGYLITNRHVAGDGAQVRLVTATGLVPAKVVKVDLANDLTLLKAEGRFTAMPVATSRPVVLGSTVVTIGFPNIALQGFAPKFARGEIASLSGPEDDARYFQISVPVQPGNSGGALVDDFGNVVGVVTAKLSAKAALSSSGALPENVNYAVKSSFLLGFLESVPEIAARLKQPNAKDMKSADVVEQAKDAAVLVLVY